MKTTEHNEWKHDPLTCAVIGCAIEVHRLLGPGLLESTYQRCLAHELESAKLRFESQAPVSVYYKGVHLDCGYRADFIIEDFLLVELKAVEHTTSVHQAQLLTYMKLAETPVGLLINFNVKLLKNGLKRLVL
ncbi:MAG: GxxExxY protein [Bdellovibrionales bacterium]|nr:GxxExxY protein [Bdellovibrionales bacterium]